MAELQVVGSGSRQGNTYLLKTSKQVLILDLGCKWDDIMTALNYEIKYIVGCFVSHFHGDHSKSIPNARKYHLPVFSCKEVSEKFRDIGVVPLQCGKKYEIGDFFIQPISVEHNCENYAFIVDCDEFGRLLFITDCVRFPYRIKGVNHLIVEANYSNDIVLDNMMNGYEIRSQNQYHMELEDTIECIKNNMSSELNNVVIAHLSDGQSDESMFADRIYDETGIMPKIASKGLIVELNKEEF